MGIKCRTRFVLLRYAGVHSYSLLFLPPALTYKFYSLWPNLISIRLELILVLYLPA